MSTIFKTSINARECAKKGEFNSSPSLTQPDQVLSITEMLHNHVRGLPMSGTNNQLIYDEDDEMPDLASMDIAEIHEMRDYYREETKRIKKEIAERKKASETPLTPSPTVIQDETLVKNEENRTE